ncbi:MAG: ABC transporter permease [Candidatus Cloacimonetes bacterium]|nr:ABC transporter permease [Candidatus Cloacimonadota bacterium]
MHNIITIAKREIRSYFYTPVAYVLMTIFLLITGWFFGSELFLVNEATMRNIFALTPLIFIFFIPAVTMRSIAEEKRSGTIELICTSPVKDSEIILGKFFAAFVLLFATIFSTIIYVIILLILGKPDGGVIVAGYLGLLFMGAAYAAIGMFGSTISKNQFVSFIIPFFVILILYLVDKFMYFVPTWLGSILQYISVDYHFQNIARGVIDTRDIIYYLSLIFLFLFFAWHSLSRRKYLSK